MKTTKSIFVVAALLFVTISIQGQEIFDAVKNNDLAKVKALVEKDGSLVNIKDDSGMTPLHWAARGVNFDVLKYLVEKGADINGKDNNGFAPLHSLVIRAHNEAIRFMLIKNADVNIRNSDGITPLHYAALTGNTDLVKLLIENGADLTARNSDGDTPLNLAVVSGEKGLIDMLFEWRADYDGSGIKALIMLQTSAKKGLDRMFKHIIEKEGDKLFADKEKNKWTVKDAVTGGSVELLKILADRKIPIEKGKDVYGWTLVHYAACKGNLEMLEYLVKEGVDINQRTNAGETAYNLAEENNHTEIQDLIIKLGGTKDAVKFPVLKGKYLGQKTPGIKPEIFAPGIISRPDFKELSITFSPDDKEIFFYAWSDLKAISIYHSRFVNGRWACPEEFSVTAQYPAGIPFISRDNKKLFFLWSNPQHPNDVWVTERTGSGWSVPQFSGRGFFMSQTRNGDIYITERPNNDRRYYIAKVTIDNNRMTNYERIVFPDQVGSRAHPCIAPDGSFIIFDEGGGDHLQVAFKKKDGTWGKALDLTQYGFEPLTGIPTISPDGKYLFFKLGCRGQLDVAHGDTNRDIWWVDIKVIERLRLKE